MSSVVVPWFDFKEWMLVYKLIYGNPSNYSKAIEHLLVWKTRCPSLPSGVESTLGLLLVLHQDSNSSKEVIQQNILRFAYSSAIIRFVNHMLDSRYAKGSSLYKAAQELGVPEWIIDLRHDTAHHNTLPTLDLFRTATNFALGWLNTQYWDKHKEVLTDYRIGQHIEIQEDEEKVRSMFQFYVTLSICLNSTNLKTLSDIVENEEMKTQLMLDIKELFGDLIDLTNPNSVSLVSLLKLTNQQFKKYIKCNNCGEIAAKTLVNQESMFMSLELVNVLGKEQFHSNSLSEHYVSCFGVLLVFLHSTNLLSDLILELLEVTRQTEYPHDFRKLASLWLSQIFQALKKSKMFLEKANKFECYKELSNNGSENLNLKLFFRHLFPNMSGGLYLDLKKPVPKEFTQLSFVQPIISAYNPYLTFFIKDLLDLLKPQLPQSNVNKICKLAHLISTKSHLKKVPFKIYTLVDLQTSENNTTKIDSDIEIVEKSEDEMEVEIVSVSEGDNIWKLASKDYNWAACPIGVLPWQLKSAQESTIEEGLRTTK